MANDTRLPSWFNASPPPRRVIVTNGNELLVQFVSDLSVTSDGFLAHYSSVPRRTRTPTSTGDFIYGPRTTSIPQKPSKPTKPSPKPKPALKPTKKTPVKIPLKPPPRKPATKPPARPTAKAKPAKPTRKTLVKKPTKPTAKPGVKPTPKPAAVKPTLRARIKPKPTPKANATLKPRPKPAKKPTSKTGVQPTVKPKVRPKATPKPGVKTTLTKKPLPSKKGEWGGKNRRVSPDGVNRISTRGACAPTASPASPPCTQPCKRTGTLQSSYCAHDFGERVHFSLQTSSVCDTTDVSFCWFPLFPPVITGKVTALLPGPGSAKVEVSLIKNYKSGRLNVTKSGPATSVTLTSACKRCPGLTKGAVQPSNTTHRPFFHVLKSFSLRSGLNYVLMGNVDAQGHGVLSPASFALLYKPVHAKALAVLSRRGC